MVAVVSEAEDEKGRQGRPLAGPLEGACPSKGAHGEIGVPEDSLPGSPAFIIVSEG